MHRIVLEVCVDSVESAVAAVNGGADRLEVCANIGVGGGTTPSMGLLKAISSVVPHTPLMVMIRPRIGDFLYSGSEFDVMLEDIRAFTQLGTASGIVFGILDAAGEVDVARSRKIVEEASPLQGTSLSTESDIAEARFHYGLSPSAPSSLPTLCSLFRYRSRPKADSRQGPKLLVGSGINPGTIQPVLDALLSLGLEEVHMSGGRWVEGGMQFRRDGLGMGAGRQVEWSVWRTSEQAVREVREILDKATVHAA
ncbi:hypothetical protein GLOTRDRAFT_31628 [Gloeophyllum trabeum ATCC 11539]|uniref:Copper homeostasis protein cutC homolog n=1 Tax=Gloeophyllum trabeum (strain ATCC 11539 / FP-39264 / Madison 617) TaxID=670483 RepID=S7RZM2_GLOTA|nr:uncharacterized protein GLOTRDRAFT_31628 [Gloeophyllum trabeum ATCC 11539]EPQ60465.1 hypothetical protein GLOTRDRAFT_31628 [Gloeophyllum trabeum ATCC 11539]